MKKYIYIFLMVSLSVLMSSCEKVLDKKPLDQFTNDNYWTSEKNVELFANHFLLEFGGYGSGSGETYFSTLNDNQASSGFTLWRYTNVPASHSTWKACYEEIRRANILIERVAGMENLTEATKNNWIGIGRLYRAWQHYCLVRTFGDCIWVERVLDVTDADKEEYLYAARMDRDMVMDKVLEDLNFATANITMKASSRVAYNNAVANAMKAEICLYEGTFSKYRSSADGQKAADDSRANKFLQECKTACSVIMGNSMYALNPSYQGNYNSLDLKGNKEMIMYKQYVLGTLAHGLIAYTASSTMLNGMTKDAFDAYLFSDGLPKASTSMDKTDHPVLDSDGNVSIAHMLAVRDGRLAQQIDAVLMYKGNGYTRYGVGMESTSSTGYGVCKFDNPAIPDGQRNQIGQNETDAPLFWLAEIYLNYAEACAELGSCTQSDLDKSVNLLRKRAGLPNMTTAPAADPANNMGVSNLIWEIRRERRVELMFDKNDRYKSLIRWHQLDKLDNTKYPNIVKGAYVKDFPGGVVVASDGYVDASNGGTRIFDKKHYLDPIPSGQIDLNEKLGQNPGW